MFAHATCAISAFLLGVSSSLASRSVELELEHELKLEHELELERFRPAVTSRDQVLEEKEIFVIIVSPFLSCT